MKRHFTVDASKRISSAIGSFRPSTKDLINNEGLDGRFDYDMEDIFTIEAGGMPLTCFTIDSEVSSMTDNGFFIDEGETDDCIKFTILVSIPEEFYDTWGHVVEDVVRIVERGMSRHFDDALDGGDYMSSTYAFADSDGEFEHLLPVLESRFSTEPIRSYVIAEVIVAPICP